MVMTTDGDCEGEKSSNIDESEVTIDFAVEVDEVSLNVTKATFQLLRAERELLNSCIQDKALGKGVEISTGIRLRTSSRTKLTVIEYSREIERDCAQRQINSKYRQSEYQQRITILPYKNFYLLRIS